MADSVLIHTYPNLSPTPHSEETPLERGIRWPTNLFQKPLTPCFTFHEGFISL